jgi:hypothetical protein
MRKSPPPFAMQFGKSIYYQPSNITETAIASSELTSIGLGKCEQMWVEWIKAGAGVFTVIGVLIAAYSILLNTQRAKKELAVNLVNSWARDYNMTMKHAFDLGKLIDRPIIERIIRRESDVKIKGHSAISAAQYILRGEDPYFKAEEDNESMQLSSNQCRIIAFQWMQTLHKIEAILIAWSSKAAASKIMSEQFTPLIDSNRDLLEKLTSSPENYYPVIRKFLERNGRTER